MGRFNDDGLAVLRSLPHLERLEMFRTRTSSAGVAALTDLKDLRIVKLDYTSVDDKGLESLQRRCPN